MSRCPKLLRWIGSAVLALAGSPSGVAGPHAGEAHILPSGSVRSEAARTVLPTRFVPYETRRFVVFSDASPRWTRLQMARLERAHHQFHRFLDRLGTTPGPLRHKLVCVLFATRDDFIEFARSHDGVVASWILGYFSPRNDRIVFYHGAETLEEEDEFADLRATATTIHEAVHQLSFHTGLQSVHINYPLWICEGLAAAFETANPDAAFGPAYEFAPRRHRFEQMLAGNRLMPLDRLVRLDHFPDERAETVQTIYNQSYALVVWLARHRRDELRAYFAAMRAETPGRPTGDRHHAIFTAAFGPPAQLERTWLRHEHARVGPGAPPLDGALAGVVCQRVEFPEMIP
ncbi:MAG: DUF1570 domain-containing protein [Phycisphaerales bacterium]|nr:DUF1570 domain-containing protein [Phycisphaerae bacterium]NNF42632.1 DUF1570 domain-containing protein [Phycisphaerales bacterium]NNM25027.1 DUF1570 domain-containing protein [Phycisphaerales bacterium]